MSIYSVVLFSGTISASAKTLFSCPAGHTYVVRDIEAFNAGSSSDHFRLDPVVSGLQIALISSPSIAAFQWWQWEGRLVIPQSDSLVGLTGTDTWDLHISGYDLLN